MKNEAPNQAAVFDQTTNTYLKEDVEPEKMTEQEITTAGNRSTRTNTQNDALALLHCVTRVIDVRNRERKEGNVEIQICIRMYVYLYIYTYTCICIDTCVRM